MPADRRWSDTDRELVARTLASIVRYSLHSQQCPVWTRRPKGLPIGDGRTPTADELARCDCWIMRDARHNAEALLDALTADGWRNGEHVAMLRTLIADLTDPDPCEFDHHGFCQAHGHGDPCPHGRAQKLLAKGANHAG